MLIDVTFFILLLLAFIKGYSRGFIISVFSCIAIFIGLAAAMKFSFAITELLANNTNVNSRWLPIISFSIVMIGVIIIVRLLAGFMQKSVELIMLGWLNRIGGVLLYAALYIILLSVVVFYANEMHLIKEETFLSSKVYTVIQPWGPKAIGMLGRVIPFFKNLCENLTDYFGALSQKVK